MTARRLVVRALAASQLAACPVAGTEQAEDPDADETITAHGDSADSITIVPSEPVDAVFGRDKSLIETPRFATTVSIETMDRLGMTDIDDLVMLSPASFTQSFFGVSGSLDLRGTSGENYFNGVRRLDNPGNYATPIGAADRVLIVRGSASVIYGPSKIRGYMNFVPKSARADTGQFLRRPTGEFSVTTGSWDKAVVAAEVGGPGKLPEHRKVEIYASAIRGLLALEPHGGKRAKYADFIDIYAGLTENERRRYRRQYPQEGATMAGIVQRARDEGMQQGRDEGMQQGRVEGMQQGRVEGERAVLQRLLRRRFGSSPPPSPTD